MDKFPIDSQTIEQGFKNMNSDETLLPIIRIITSHETSASFVQIILFQLPKKILFSIYKNYFKRIPFLRRSIQWGWRKGFPIYIKCLSFFLSTLNKWRPIIRQSIFSQCSLENRYFLGKETAVETTVLSVLPSEKKHYLEPTKASYIFPEIFVTTIKNAHIYGGSNLIITSENVLCHDLYDFSRDYTSEELHGRILIDAKGQRIRLIVHDRKPEQLSVAASFVDACALNYAHWLTEVLPRICFFCSDNRFDGIPIIINDGLHANLLTSLFLIVGTEREIFALPIGRAVNVAHLYITSPTGYIPFEQRTKKLTEHCHGVFSPVAFKALRQRLSERMPQVNHSTFPKKIYLRRNSDIRKLINDTEVEAILFKRGFSIIATEQLTFTQQVVLFQNAEVVISPTGAACANIIFCNPLTNIVILMAIHDNMPYRYWMHMANAVGIKKISYILGNIVHNAGLGFHGDFQIPITELVHYLNTLEKE